MTAAVLLLAVGLARAQDAAAPAPEAPPIRGRLVAAGVDLSEYVVWLPEGARLPELPPSAERPAMNQLRKAFSPAVVAVRAGGSVLFENLDTVFHNVFSLDKRNPFDLGLYKGRQRFGEDRRAALGSEGAPAQRFPLEGKFAVYCNIHPDMAGTVHAFGHGYFARGAKDGSFSLPAPASGRHRVLVDGPRLARPQEAVLDAEALRAAGEAGRLEIRLALKRFRLVAPHTRKDGSDYSGYARP